MADISCVREWGVGEFGRYFLLLNSAKHLMYFGLSPGSQVSLYFIGSARNPISYTPSAFRAVVVLKVAVLLLLPSFLVVMQLLLQ